MKSLRRFRRNLAAKRFVSLAVAVLLAAAGVGLAIAADDDEALVYDSVLGRTVPLAYQQALRDVEPSTLPEEGEVIPGAGVDPPQDAEEDTAYESASPVPAAIAVIPVDKQTGIIIDETIDLDGGNDLPGTPVFLSRTGLLTLTSFTDEKISFSTASGRRGYYSLISKEATLCSDREPCGAAP